MTKIFVLITAFIMSSLAADGEDPKPWISLRTKENTFALTATSRYDTLSLPLHFDKDVAFKKVSVKNSRAAYVKLNNKIQTRYLEGFTIKKDSAQERIDVVTDFSKIRETGSYEMLLLFNYEGREEVPVLINLVRPSAELDTVRTVKILIEGGTFIRNPLEIRERKNQSGVFNLSLPPPSVSGCDTGKLITFPDRNLDIAPGSVLHIRYYLDTKLAESLPLGKTKANLIIYAPEQTTPLVVPFEIKRIHSKSIIIWVTLLGIGIGFLVRTYLALRQRIAEKRIIALGLCETMQRETINIQDQNYATSIGNIVTSLHQEIRKTIVQIAVEKKTETYLTEEIKNATNDYNLKKNAFVERLAKTTADLNLLSTIFETGTYGQFVQQLLVEPGKKYVESVQFLKGRDATSAEKEVAEIMRKLREILHIYTVDVGYLLVHFIDEAAFPATVLPAEARTFIKERARKIQSGIASIEVDSNDIQKMNTSFEKVNAEHVNYSGLMKFIGEVVSAEFLRVFRDDGSSEMKNFKETYATWNSELEAIVSKPASEPKVTMTATELLKAWAVAAEHKLAAATRMSNPDQPLSPLPLPEIDNYQSPPARSIFALIPKGIVTMGASDITASMVDVTREWLLVGIIRNLFIFLLIAYAAYKFYEPSFVGTFQDIAGIFLFAFSLDVTIDNILLVRDKK